MKTFTLNDGNTYIQQDNGYCFAIIGGKKIRCSAASFEMAHDQFIKEENERQNAVNEFTNIEPKTEQPTKKTRKLGERIHGVTPKAKKTRKAKDAQEFNVSGTQVLLTTKQVDFLRHLPDTCFWESGLDSTIWVDCLCDDIQGQFAGKPMTVGAMVSTLCEKGLGVRATERREKRKCTSFALTELGKQVAAMLGVH